MTIISTSTSISKMYTCTEYFGPRCGLHTGNGNLDINYKMSHTVLGTTVKVKDFGITISADMKVSEQCGMAASKGNQILGLIRRNITYKENVNYTFVKSNS